MSKTKDCPACGGTGVVDCPTCSNEMDCDECDGSGVVKDDE